MTIKKVAARVGLASRAAKKTAGPAVGVAKEIEAYFAAASPVGRTRLAELRAAIKAAFPDAVETFSYRIPGFRLDDRAFVWYAAFKEHVSMYPLPRDFEQANAKALAKYHTSGKGTLQFPLDKPVPRALVAKVAKARAVQLRAAAAARKKR